jgi:hypothetical protein
MHDTDTLIRSDLFGRIQRKKERLDAHRPLPESAVRKLRDELRLLHTYHSNAIEGNTLSLQETKLVLAEGLTIGGKSIREHLEATNNAEAFDLIEAITKEKREINHISIQRIHEVVTRGIDADAGKYRVHNVRITGATKTPPDFSKVYHRIDNLIASLQDTEKREHPIKTATFLHHKLSQFKSKTRIVRCSENRKKMVLELLGLYKRFEDKKPVMLLDIQEQKIYAYPYNDFKSELSKRSQIQLEEQYEAAILNNEMVVFVRDNKKKELVSYSLEYREND